MRGHPRRSYKLTFALLALPAIAYALLQSLVVPALTDIQHALHTSVNSVSWVLTGYLISAAVATPVIGRLGDIYGKKRVLIAVLVVMSVATAVCALATTLPVLVAGRFVQGTSGGIYPLAFGIIRDEFPRERVAWGVGLMSALVGIGGVAGVVLAGPIVDHLSLSYLFWLPLVLIVLATVSIVLLIPESPVRMPGRINWTGAVLMALGLTSVMLAITQASDWHWLSAKTLVGLCRRGDPACALGAQRERKRLAARRHADDADPRCVDDQSGRVPDRCRLVRVVRVDPRVGPGTGAARLRLRRVGQRSRAVPRAGDGHDADHRDAGRSARGALRLASASARGDGAARLPTSRSCLWHATSPGRSTARPRCSVARSASGSRR